MPFESDLIAKQVGDVDWQLYAPLRYRGNQDEFVVPVGEETDFASIPGVFQWLLPKSGRYTKAAVLHDYLSKKGPKLGVNRKDADGLFRRCMRELEVPFLRRWTMWGGVRGASIVQSRFKDGPGDLPRVILVFFYPGIFIVLSGVVVWLLLLSFSLLEALAAGVLAVLRLIPAARAKVKPVVAPKVRLAPKSPV